MFYLTTHSTHFIYGYMASDIWLRTILIVRKETHCHHIGYSYRLTARVLLYAPFPLDVIMLLACNIMVCLFSVCQHGISAGPGVPAVCSHYVDPDPGDFLRGFTGWCGLREHLLQDVSGGLSSFITL